MRGQDLKKGGMITMMALHAEKGAFDEEQYSSVPTVLILRNNPTSMEEAVAKIPFNLRI